MAQEAIFVSDTSGDRQRKCYPVTPNRWQGQKDCVVGPFSDQRVANYFRDTVVNFNRPARIFPLRDAWYVEVLEDSQRVAKPAGEGYALSDR